METILSQTTLILMLITYIAGLITAMILLLPREHTRDKELERERLEVELERAKLELEKMKEEMQERHVG